MKFRYKIEPRTLRNNTGWKYFEVMRRAGTKGWQHLQDAHSLPAAQAVVDKWVSSDKATGHESEIVGGAA